jgi:cyclophilin family peptidyl-prolyl cis-trans isomerase
MTLFRYLAPTGPVRAAVALAAVAVIAAGCTGFGASTPKPTAVATASPPPVEGVAPSSSTAGSVAPSGATTTCPTSQPAPMPAGEQATVTLGTSLGPIIVQVEGSLGPNAAGNFVALAECGYYNGVIFHRLAPGFVIQGGDGQYGREPNIDDRVGSGGPGYEFADDPVTVPYSRGTVAMANSGPNTNGSQFFIVLQDAQLPPSYSVFGHVTSGMDVVDQIAAMPNGGGSDGRALQPVAITTATVAR